MRSDCHAVSLRWSAVTATVSVPPCGGIQPWLGDTESRLTARWWFLDWLSRAASPQGWKHEAVAFRGLGRLLSGAEAVEDSIGAADEEYTQWSLIDHARARLLASH